MKFVTKQNTENLKLLNLFDLGWTVREREQEMKRQHHQHHQQKK